MRSLLAFSTVLLLAAVTGAKESPPITVTSPAFSAGGPIPMEYTCDGRGVSPPLSWTDLPAGTKSVAVIIDDPDAPGGTFTHLVLYNLPPTQSSLPSQSSTQAETTHAVSARNSGGKTGFTPICPPHGRHHYRFQVFALDTMLPRTLAGGAEDAVVDAMKGHVLARGELLGVYQPGGLPK